MQLATPTNCTHSGPRFRNQGSEFVVDYDYEESDGSIEWSRIVFNDVLVFEFRQMACCRANDIIPATEIRSLDQSDYLVEALNSWQQAVGWQEWQRDQGGAGRFKHFTMFFDDVGCVNVIAASCKVSRNVEGSKTTEVDR